MDIASIVGILMGISVLVLSILIAPGATFKAFIDYPSIMVVIGGALSAVLISFPLRNILGTFKVFKNVFTGIGRTTGGTGQPFCHPGDPDSR